MTNEITITREEFMKVSARVSSKIVDSLAKEAEKSDGYVDSTMLVGQTLSHLMFSSELACVLFGAEQKGE